MKMKGYEIVEEDLSTCFGSLGLPKKRYYVIKSPIANTGICYEFRTRDEAEAWIKNMEG